MTVTDWIQAVSTAILVVITAIYAWRTHVISVSTEKAAEASLRMAKEMEKTRFGTVLPIIDIIEISRLEQYFDDDMEMEYVKEGRRHQGTVPVKLRNVGVGPALDVKFNRRLEAGTGDTNEYTLSSLGVGEITDEYYHLAFDVVPGNGAEVLGMVEVKYNDSYGNPKTSRRPFLRISTVGKDLGPLQLS